MPKAKMKRTHLTELTQKKNLSMKPKWVVKIHPVSSPAFELRLRSTPLLDLSQRCLLCFCAQDRRPIPSQLVCLKAKRGAQQMSERQWELGNKAVGGLPSQVEPEVQALFERCPAACAAWHILAGEGGKDADSETRPTVCAGIQGNITDSFIGELID